MGISVFQIIAIVFFVLAFVFLVLTIVTFFNQDIASVIGYFTGKTQKRQIEQIKNQTMNINYGAKAKSANNSVKPVAAAANMQVNADANAHPSKSLARKPKAAVEAPKISSFIPAADGGTVSLDSINADTSANSSTDVLAGKTSQDFADDVPTDVLSDDVPTDVLSDDVPTDVLTDDVPTDVLSDDVPTDVLSDDVPTDVLSDDVPTDVLTDDVPTDVLSNDIETTVLSNDDIGTTVLSQDINEVSPVPEGFEFIESTSFKDTDEVIE